jgi:hypothetical protein
MQHGGAAGAIVRKASRSSLARRPSPRDALMAITGKLGQFQVRAQLVDGLPELDRFPRIDPRDVGCDQVMEILHVYAELAGRRW